MFRTMNEKKPQGKFLLRGKKFIPSSSRLNESDLKNELFQAIQDLPTVESCPDDVENGEHFNQENALSVLEKGTATISYQQGKYTIAGTEGLHTCLGVSFYVPKIKKLVIVHIDQSPFIEELDSVLAEFTSGNKIDVRVFGGLAKEQSISFNDPTLASINKAKEVFWYLYSKSALITFDFRSSNIFHDLNEYRAACYKSDLQSDIGFAVNSENGKVFLFHCSILDNAALPYSVLFENCGLFSGAYKNGHVNVSFLQYIGYATRIMKHYDAYHSNWDEVYHEELNALSKEGIAKAIYLTLVKINYTASTSTMKPIITNFIISNLDAWRESFGFTDLAWYELLIQKCAYDEMNKKDEYKHKLQAMKFELNSVFINDIMPEVTSWYLSASRFFILEALRKIRKDFDHDNENNFFTELQICLQQSKGVGELTKTFIQFEQGMSFPNEGIDQKNLFAKLCTCQTEKIPFHISEWRSTYIDKQINLLVSGILYQLNYTFNVIRPFHEEVEKILVNIINSVFKDHHIHYDDINLDLFDNYSKDTKALINRVDAIFQENNHQINSSFSLKTLCIACQDRLSNYLNLEQLTTDLGNEISKYVLNCMHEEDLNELDEDNLHDYLLLNVDKHSADDNNEKCKDSDDEHDSKYNPW